MKKGLVIRLFLCIAATALCLYLHIERQNSMTQLRLEIPTLAKEVEQIEHEIERVQFEIDQFENPAYLMELARRPEYSHLRQPRVDEVIVVQPAEVQ